MLKLVYLSPGLGRNKTWMQMSFIQSNYEKRAHYFLLKYIYSYQLFQFFPPNSPKSLSVFSSSRGLWEGVFPSGGGRVIMHLALHQQELQYFNSPDFPCACSPPAPLNVIAWLTPQRAKCAKWTWQIPGWLHMARPDLVQFLGSPAALTLLRWQLHASQVHCIRFNSLSPGD